MAEKRRRISEEKRKILAKKRKRKKMFYSIVGTILALAILASAVLLTVELVSGDKNQTGDEIISQDTSQETSSQTLDNEEIVNSKTEELTPQETQVPVNDIPPEGDFGMLVSVSNPLPSDYVPEVRAIEGTDKLFDVRAADDLERMLSDAAAAGYPMYLVSTYRTIEYQEGLYNRKVNEYINAGYSEESAKTEAAKWVAIPGTSEHNLGLAADIVSSTWYNTNSDLTQEFENTEHFEWLKENSPSYGFLISFQKGKEDITGIVYEPWHYRYVGVELATYLTNNNLSLNEYHEMIN